MTVEQLNAAVARATGEDIDLIAGRGFSLIDECPSTSDEEWEALALDWDRLDAERCGNDLFMHV
ncbi:hypothetical protein [Schlesneria paludicola]|uniref:hypothetical protein n=1 Tax=Schlesneria paludicola TaxID=360056 RepID=UPI00029A0CB8|nr:hypothetical protein [Schlesneria paludicola]